MDIAETKKLARAAAYAQRKRIHAVSAAAACATAEFVVDFAARGEADIVSAYLPIRTEIDPRPAMLALHDRGWRLCVPVIDGPRLPLRFRTWTPGCVLRDGPFGARVPVEGDWLQPDLLLVPLLAFDTRLYRLGYGGGFYDRTLALLRGRGKVLAAGFAYAGQQVAQVPADGLDQRLDVVITEAGIVTA